MKKANIYKVSINDKSAKESKKEIICVATNISKVIDTISPSVWNNYTQNSEYVKYKESDIIEVKLVEEGVIVQDYISDYKEEEE